MEKINITKQGFSLIELIFAIVIIGIISTVAIPKLMSLNSKANISTIKQDTNSIISATQSYYVINGKIDKISDAININSSVWDITDKTVKYIQNGKDCIKLTIASDTLNITINENAGNICQELKKQGVVNQTFNLN